MNPDDFEHRIADTQPQLQPALCLLRRADSWGDLKVELRAVDDDLAVVFINIEIRIYVRLNLRPRRRPATFNYKNNEEEGNEQRIRRRRTRQVR